MKKIFCYYDIDQWGGYRFHIKTPKIYNNKKCDDLPLASDFDVYN
jgi:hypothetical protein